MKNKQSLAKARRAIVEDEKDLDSEMASRKFPFRVRYGHVAGGKAINEYKGFELEATAITHVKLLIQNKKVPKTVSMIDVEQRSGMEDSPHFDLLHRWTKKGKQWKRIK